MGESSKIATSGVSAAAAETPPAAITTPTGIAMQDQQQQQELPQELAGTSSGCSSTSIAAMAYNTNTTSKTDEAGNIVPLSETDRRELEEIRKLLWGDSIRVDVFRRWSQGFEFSEIEPSALVQKQGGPCAVIAPVQAYLLKILLAETPSLNLKELTADKCRRLLIEALCNILNNCKAKPYRIVTLPQSLLNEAKETAAEVANAASEVGDESESNPASPEIAVEAITVDVPIPQIIEIAPDEFHQRLQVTSFNTLDDVKRFYTENFDTVGGQYGVLLFMYSVFLTKGIENVNSEISDLSEPLIHNTYGYGSQALINLMLTGRAVAHVWDNDQDVGGLKLPGINEQNEVGFITLMEQMRYCTVGSFFKNPRNPVWVMGSETHLTVLFSNEKRLVSPETPSELARRVFKSYDPDGNNFIPTAVLQDVMASLDLVSEPEYVDLMSRRLDPEGLGIILLNAFMDEFFQQEKRSTPDTFDLMHYNGIPGSNDGNKVHYCRGSAILLECDLKSHCASNPMMTCLQTKWPNIEINWHDMRIPSLN